MPVYDVPGDLDPAGIIRAVQQMIISDLQSNKCAKVEDSYVEIFKVYLGWNVSDGLIFKSNAHAK